MVALYTARICEFFVEHLCSGLWSGSFSVFPPSHPYFSSFHCFISVTGAWNGGSWLGCGDLPAMGAVVYLGAGWPQWKPLGIPGTHLPIKRGSWLTQVWLCPKLDRVQRKTIFTACHSGKLKLAFTSPDVISTSPKSFSLSRIDFTLLLLFEFLKEHHLPVGQVKNRFH